MGQRKEARKAFAAALELDESNPTILSFERASLMASEWTTSSARWSARAQRPSPRRASSFGAPRRACARHRRAQGGAGARHPAHRPRSGSIHGAGALPRCKGLLYAHERWRDLIAVLGEEATQATDSERARCPATASDGSITTVWARSTRRQRAESAVTEPPPIRLILGSSPRVRASASAGRSSRGAGANSRRHRVHRRARRAHASRRAEFGKRLGDADGRPDGIVAPSTAIVVRAGAPGPGELYTRSGHWTALIAMHLAKRVRPRTTRAEPPPTRASGDSGSKLGNVDQARGTPHGARSGSCPAIRLLSKALTRLYAQGKRSRARGAVRPRRRSARDNRDEDHVPVKIGVRGGFPGCATTAMAAYRRILRLDPGHSGRCTRLQRSADADGWDELIAALDEEAERVTEPSGARRRPLSRRGSRGGEPRRRGGAVARCKKVPPSTRRNAPVLSASGAVLRRGPLGDLLTTYSSSSK